MKTCLQKTHTSVFFSCFVCNSPKAETVQTFFKQWMVTRKIYIHTRRYHSTITRDELLIQPGWRSIMLRDQNLTPKVTVHIVGFHLYNIIFFFKFYLFASSLRPTWGSNSWFRDQESRAPPSEPARRPYITFLKWQQMSDCQGQGEGVAIKKKMRDPCSLEMLCVLPLSISWLRCCTMILQDVLTGGNLIESTEISALLFTVCDYLCIIFYNPMWIYSDLKIESLIKQRKILGTFSNWSVHALFWNILTQALENLRAGHRDSAGWILPLGCSLQPLAKHWEHRLALWSNEIDNKV